MIAADVANPIRVLALLDDTVVSGKVKPVLTLARYARAERESSRPLDISMLTFVRGDTDPEMVEQLRSEGFALDVVRERRRFDLGVFEQMRDIVARRRPDVLWTHGAKTHFLVRAVGLQRGRIWAASHHGYTATSLTWRLYDQLDRWSLRGADAVMPACEAFADDLNARLGIKRERMSVHRTPIAAGSTAPQAKSGELRGQLGLPADAAIVLSVGRLSKEKGHADLIAAMPEIAGRVDRPVALVIVGDGPEEAQLERLRAQFGVADLVRLAGYQADVAPYYAAADAFALPSYSEGSPNVLLEAMDAGVPIVATAVGGIGEMIRDGEQGLLVPARDSAGLANAVVSLLSDRALRDKLIAAGRRSLADYAPARYYDGVSALFAKLLEESRA